MKQFIVIVLIFISASVIGQTQDKEKAKELKQAAIQLMDDGNFDESIKLLKQAEKLDPNNYVYQYEIGYAFYVQEDYKNAVKTSEKVIKYETATDMCYQMLGNSYDMAGNPEKAIEAYIKGIEKFPNSGRLYLELGNMQNDLTRALQYYEKGIEVDPTYPSNYYRAAKLFLENSDQEVWGMIYGEIFLNLERTTDRTDEISKMLYDTYKNEIKITSDTSYSVSFCKNSTISPPAEDEITLPFGMIYENILLFSIINIDSINLLSLNSIRTNFLNLYFEKGFNKEYPNVLFDWQKTIEENGFLESYNYWLMMIGNEDEFYIWHEINKYKFSDFVDWFNENQIEIDDSNRFLRKE